MGKFLLKPKHSKQLFRRCALIELTTSGLIDHKASFSHAG